MDNKMSVPENATLVERLERAAAEIARDGHNGWGNTMLEAAAALRATGEGEWVMVPKDALLAKIREGLGVDGTIYRDVEAMLAAAPTPAEPLRDAGAADPTRWAQGLIEQLPSDHDGRNSWLLNYGVGDEADWRRAEHTAREAEWAEWRPGQPMPERRRYAHPAPAQEGK